jgi:OOP family OmpA-OmpF porin
MYILKIPAMLMLLLFSLSCYAELRTDADRDGIPDAKDLCPNNSFEELSKGVEKTGCPIHSDADGVPDYKDFCPDTPKGVRINHAGCAINLHSKASLHIFNKQAFNNFH